MTNTNVAVESLPDFLIEYGVFPDQTTPATAVRLGDLLHAIPDSLRVPFLAWAPSVYDDVDALPLTLAADFQARVIATTTIREFVRTYAANTLSIADDAWEFVDVDRLEAHLFGGQRPPFAFYGAPGHIGAVLMR